MFDNWVWTKNKKIILMVWMVSFIWMVFPMQAMAKNKVSVSLNGKRAIIMDMDSEEVLYGKRIEQKCENASTTKLLTAITAVENGNLNKKVKISKKAASTEPVCLYLKRGESYYMKELLHAMLIMSANDASVAVAEGMSGSVKKFLKDMNKKAKEIGCLNTHFATPNGLHTGKAHYTTAYDMALITKHAYNNDTIRRILMKKKYSVKSVHGKKKKIENTNVLLKDKKAYCVGKTGVGSKAKYCFAGVYTYKGHSYVLVTFGCENDAARWKDMKKMVKACQTYVNQNAYVTE